ncbi:hypothetical protein BDQ17DRAFT_1251030, partial [Cyathus striatus]
LSHNNRPTSTHLLTKASVHFYSYVALSLIWIALTIMIFTQTPYECNFEEYFDGSSAIWCGFSAASGATAALSFISGASFSAVGSRFYFIIMIELAAGAAVVIYLDYANTHEGLSGNVSKMTNHRLLVANLSFN